MKWIEKVFRPDAKFARKIKRYKFWLGQFSQILGWPRWRNLTRTPTIKCWVTRELYSAIPKFFSEKVDVQRKDQQCYWSSLYVWRQLISWSSPFFKESTRSCKSRHPLEDWSPIEFLKWLICGLELKRTPNLFSYRSFPERMGLMVSEEPAEELPEEPLSQLVSTGLRWDAGQLQLWILSQLSIECRQLTNQSQLVSTGLRSTASSVNTQLSVVNW